MKNIKYIVFVLSLSCMQNVLAKVDNNKKSTAQMANKAKQHSAEKDKEVRSPHDNDAIKVEQDNFSIPTVVKNDQVFLMNRFELPLIFGIYDFKAQQLTKVSIQIPSKNAVFLPRDFFASNMKEAMKHNDCKLVMGCAYGVEVKGPKNSHFIPNWKGVGLETKNIIVLSKLFNEANVIMASMFLLGEYPVAFFNAPEINVTQSIPCGDIKAIFDDSYDTVKSIFDTKEFYNLLWATGFNEIQAMQKIADKMSQKSNSLEVVDNENESIV